jgi:hypothetical protein
VQLLFAPTEETALILFASRKNPDLNALSFWMQILLALGTLTIAGSQMAGYQVIGFFFGAKWVTDSCIELFRAYALHIFCCALNGVAEAYNNAKGDSEALGMMRAMMVVQNLSYLGLCYLLAVSPGYFGFRGLVYANMLNMFFRGITNLYFAVAHEYSSGNSQKRSFFSNLIATFVWMAKSLFMGKTYIALTGVGVVLIYLLNGFVLPIVFGSLWSAPN